MVNQLTLVTAITRFASELRNVRNIADRRTFLRYLSAVLRESPRILRTRSLRTADTRMAGRECKFVVESGARVCFDGECFGLAREIYGRRIYANVKGFEIHKDEVVMDLGANVGVFAVMAGALGARVVAVEAQSGLIPTLVDNLSRNGVRNWSIEWALVGAGTGAFSREQVRRNASHWKDTPPTITLDQLIEKHQLERIDLIKIDIEGSEFDLLRGSPTWLNRITRMVMEVHQEYGDAKELVELLRGSGFVVEIIDTEQRQVERLKGDYGFIFARRSIGANTVRVDR